MSGYREHSYDPYAYEQEGPPLCPFDRVQWVGVAFEVVALAVFAVYLAGAFGWIAPVVDSIAPAFAPALIGTFLINTRRGPPTQVGPEQRRRHRNILIVTLAIALVILGAAALIDSIGVEVL